MKQLPISNAPGQWAMVDDGDYDRARVFRWHIAKGYVTTNMRANGKMRTMRLHRWLTDAPFGMVVDHVDGNPLNNQRANLRLVSHLQNSFNQRKTSKATYSKYKGVSLDRDKWCAYINRDGKREWLGRFPTEEAAAKAYDVAAMRLHGDMARLNFPESELITQRSFLEGYP